MGDPSAWLQVGATVLGAGAAIAEGKSENAIAQYQATLAENRAQEERVKGEHEATEKRMKGALAMSRARAVGAASGGGVDIDLMGDLSEETELQALTALWQGNQRGADAENQAAELRYSGKSKKRAGIIRGTGTLLGGLGTVAERHYTPSLAEQYN
jgi:hypothetical protein